MATGSSSDPPDGTAAPRRVSLVGARPDLGLWSDLLQVRADLEVTEGPEAPGSEADLVIAFPGPSDARDWLARLAGAAPAVALLTSSGDGPHPLTSLVGAMARAKAAWEGTFDAMADPVALVDKSGRVARGNVALGRLLGRSVRDVVGRQIAELLGGAAEGVDPVSECLAHGRPCEGEVRYRELDGPCEVTAVPMRDGDGWTALVVLRDLERARERHERLLRTARLADVGQLAGGVAHEINTPLASIALRAESLSRAAQDPRLQAIDTFKNFPRYLETIQQEVFRCKKIISSLVEFARSPAPEVRDVDLSSLCERAADLLRHEVEVRGATLELRLGAGLPQVPGDASRLTQVVVALLMNARDAVREGGTIVVETRSVEAGLELVVADDGEGIPPENVARIFTPFFTTRPPGHGTGLGLSTCHAIVTAHGGTVHVTSSPGDGARFTLLLPFGSPAGSRAPAPPPRD